MQVIGFATSDRECKIAVQFRLSVTSVERGHTIGDIKVFAAFPNLFLTSQIFEFGVHLVGEVYQRSVKAVYLITQCFVLVAIDKERIFQLVVLDRQLLVFAQQVFLCSVKRVFSSQE